MFVLLLLLLFFIRFPLGDYSANYIDYTAKVEENFRVFELYLASTNHVKWLPIAGTVLANVEQFGFNPS